MLQMDLPHLNVLTKIDNLNNYPDLPFNLDYYTEVQDLSYLLPHLNREQNSGIPGPRGGRKPISQDNDDGEEVPESKYAALNKAIVELVEDFALVGFETLAVEDKKSMMYLLRAIDRAGGYAFGSVEGANVTVWQVAMRQDAVTMEPRDVQERWLDRREEMDEEERTLWAQETAVEGAPSTSRHDQSEAQPPGDGLAQKLQPTPRDMDDDMADDDDLEQMRKYLEKQKDEDGGIKVVRKG
jgi:GPN-loop GTPase